MKKIRQGLFETNSSSTHAICICTNRDLLKKMKFPEEIYFGIGAHGWEFEKLTTPEEKANYLYTAILCLYSDKKIYSKKIDCIYKNLLKIGILANFEKPQVNEYGRIEAYMDHPSGLKGFVDSMIRNQKMLCKYLFSDYSFIQKGNDNSYDSVDINVDYDHKEYYKWN